MCKFYIDLENDKMHFEKNYLKNWNVVFFGEKKQVFMNYLFMCILSLSYVGIFGIYIFFS